MLIKLTSYKFTRKFCNRVCLVTNFMYLFIAYMVILLSAILILLTLSKRVRPLSTLQEVNKPI